MTKGLLTYVKHTFVLSATVLGGLEFQFLLDPEGILFLQGGEVAESN